MTFEERKNIELAELAELIRDAEDGDSGAQLELAQKYDPECFNDYIPPDGREALKWYRRAAENGEYQAMRSLGRINQYGMYEVEKNLETAAMWYREAINTPNPNGDYEAKMDLMYLMEELE